MNTLHDPKYLRLKCIIYQLLACIFILVIIVLLETSVICYGALVPAPAGPGHTPASQVSHTEGYWQPPSEATIPAGESGALVTYGRELISHTARYLGPQGSVAQISNGMNCQNCHLASGTLPFGNNYSAVAATYPRFRARSGTEETIVKRVSDCFERSLNGTAPDASSREMHAIRAYIEWLGSNVKPGQKPAGSGLNKPALLAREADSAKGNIIYERSCRSCHGKDGEGLMAADGLEYAYPPLWGPNSYNDAAGLYRISNFAGFVRNNMPLGATHDAPQLTPEEAWDVAAFVNSMPRPHKDQSADWQDIRTKPTDYPFGPYADGFSEKQHKLGPFGPIEAAQ